MKKAILPLVLLLFLAGPVSFAQEDLKVHSVPDSSATQSPTAPALDLIVQENLEIAIKLLRLMGLAEKATAAAQMLKEGRILVEDIDQDGTCSTLTGTITLDADVVYPWQGVGQLEGKSSKTNPALSEEENQRLTGKIRENYTSNIFNAAATLYHEMIHCLQQSAVVKTAAGVAYSLTLGDEQSELEAHGQDIEFLGKVMMHLDEAYQAIYGEDLALDQKEKILKELNVYLDGSYQKFKDYQKPNWVNKLVSYTTPALVGQTLEKAEAAFQAVKKTLNFKIDEFISPAQPEPTKTITEIDQDLGFLKKEGDHYNFTSVDWLVDLAGTYNSLQDSAFKGLIDQSMGERTNLNFIYEDGEKVMAGLEMQDDKIIKVYSDALDKPNVDLAISRLAVADLLNADNFYQAALAAFREDQIKVEHHSWLGKIKYFVYSKIILPLRKDSIIKTETNKVLPTELLLYREDLLLEPDQTEAPAPADQADQTSGQARLPLAPADADLDDSTDTGTDVATDTTVIDTSIKSSDVPKNLNAYIKVASLSPDTSDISCDTPPSYKIFAAFEGSLASDISTGTYTYHWDFRDGHSADGKDLAYGYELKGAGPWQSTATLTVTHVESGTKAAATKTINFPCQSTTPATGPDQTITAYIHASRQTADTSQADCTEIKEATYEFTGRVVEALSVDEYTYAWNFGDGSTGQGADVSHAYTITGEGPWEYTAALTATHKESGKKDTTSTSITIPCEKKPITVSLASALTSAKSCAPASYDFTAMVTSSHAADTKYTYTWEMEYTAKTSSGPTTSKTSTTSHTYSQVGAYTAKVTVTAQNLEAGVATKTLAVSECEEETLTPPVALAAYINSPATYDNICLGDSVSFVGSATASGTTSDFTYAWNFGDGSTGQGKTVQQAYTTIYPCPQTVTVTLTVTNGSGLQAQKTLDIVINGCGRCDELGVAYLKNEGYTYNSSLLTTAKATNTILVPDGKYDEDEDIWVDLYVDGTVGQGPTQRDVLFYLEASDSDYFFRTFSYPSGCVEPALPIVQGFSPSLFSIRTNDPGDYRVIIRKINQASRQYGPALIFVWTAANP